MCIRTEAPRRIQLATQVVFCRIDVFTRRGLMRVHISIFVPRTRRRQLIVADKGGPSTRTRDKIDEGTKTEKRRQQLKNTVQRKNKATWLKANGYTFYHFPFFLCEVCYDPLHSVPPCPLIPPGLALQRAVSLLGLVPA